MLLSSPARWHGRVPALPGGAPSLTPGRPPGHGPTAARFEFAARPLIGRAGRARAEGGLQRLLEAEAGAAPPLRAAQEAEELCAQPGGVGRCLWFMGRRFGQPSGFGTLPSCPAGRHLSEWDGKLKEDKVLNQQAPQLRSFQRADRAIARSRL